MLGTPSSALIAGAQAVVVAGVLWLFGLLLADALTRSRLSWAATMALAFPALLAWVLVVMLVHIVTGGLVLSEPWLVRSLTALAAATAVIARLWIARKGAVDRPTARSYAWLLGAALAAAAVASLWPLLRLLPVPPTPDAQLHSGWAMQLLAGDTTPGATITGDVPNYYPWLFHALTAFVARFTPGGHPWHALGVIQVLQVTAVVAALFATGRELTGRMTGGLSAAAFGAFAGGVGFVLLRGVDVAPRGRVPGADGVMQYAGDLLVARPYNVTFFNLPPPLPRDVAFALVATVLFALVAAFAQGNRAWLIVAGSVSGLIGLTGGESWIVALLVGIVVCLVGSSVSRWRALGYFLGPALAVYCVWFVPTLINYLSLGGFVDTTHQAPVVLPPLGFLGAWGIMVPFALWGLVRATARWRDEPRMRVVIAAVVGSVAAVFVSPVIPLVLGEAFSTLETKHRYWPYVHLAVALCGALGLADIVGRVAKRNVSSAAVLVAGVVAVGLVSPVVSALDSTRGALDDQVYRVTNASLLPGSKTVPAVLLDRRQRDCVVAVPPELSQSVFAFTGFRQVLWQGGARGSNRARIRWRDIYERIARDRVRVAANETLTEGSGKAWRRAVDRFGVDLIVAEASAERREPFTRYPSRRARFGPAGEFMVFEVGDC